MAGKAVKKEKAAKLVKSKTGTEVINVKAVTRFVSFTFGATIPTQSFGNIQPHITVEAPTYEEARDFAIPKIEELYRKYAEIKPEFLGKITETVREVTPPVQETPEKEPEVAPKEPVVTPTEDSAPVAKAKKAISLAMTYDAIKIVEDQIMKSVKILPEEKPALYELTLKKAKELKEKN